MDVVVSAILVNHNGGDLLTRSLGALREATGSLAVETIVIDNGSTDGSADSLVDPPTVLIRSGENLGFGRANNVGALQARGEYVLLLNTDCFLEPGALAVLVDRMAAEPRAAVVSPRLVNPDGSLQPSCHDFPRPLVLFVEQTSLWRKLFGRRSARWLTLADSHDRARQVEWSTAACWLVRASAWRELGGFDPGYFFYWEEADLCYRFDQRGWQVWFEPEARAMHLGGASSDGVALLRYFFAGLARFYRLHYSTRRRVVARGIVSCLAIWRITQHVVGGIRAATPEARRWNRTARTAWFRVLIRSAARDA